MLGENDRGGPAHDLGLQAERTAMAWERTALGVGGVSALLLHDTGSLVTKVPGLVGLVVALVLLILTQVRYEQTVRRLGRGQAPGAERLVLALSCTVTVLAVLSIGVIIVQGGS